MSMAHEDSSSDATSDDSQEPMDIDTDQDLDSAAAASKKPIFRVRTFEGDIFNYNEEQLRLISQRVNDKFVEGYWDQNGFHDVPWLTNVAAKSIEKYIATRRIDLTKKTRPHDLNNILRAAKWLGLDYLTHDIFKFVQKDCESKDPSIFKRPFDAAVILARYVATDDHKDIHDKLVNKAIDSFSHRVAKLYVEALEAQVGLLLDSLGRRAQATAWKILARVLAADSDHSAGLSSSVSTSVFFNASDQSGHGDGQPTTDLGIFGIGSSESGNG